MASPALTAKDQYKALCDSGVSIPIFSEWWWLDTVCGRENWDVVLIEKGGTIFGSMPYYSKIILGNRIITMPLLTQTMGPLIRYPAGQKYARKLGYEKDILGGLIDQLPKSVHFVQNFDHSITNVLPFYWRHFDFTVNYTYILEDISDLNCVWSNFQENIRREIRKAQTKVVVRSDLSLEQFIHLNELTYKRQGKKLSYKKDLVHDLDTVCAERDARRIFFAEDAKGRLHAAAYIVWDKNSAFYLMGGGDPALRNSGATSLVMWEAIKFAATVTQSFDFEGSMLEPVERFFRAFGAKQTPYFRVKQTKGSGQLLLAGRGIFNSLCGK